MLARASLGEEGGEAVIVVRGVGGQGSVRQQPMLQAIEVPTGVAHLNSGLKIQKALCLEAMK